MKKLFFILMGGITFAIGTAAVFIPFVPTTPFYLLTTFFWANSSEKLHTYLVNHRYYQKYIQETLVEKKITTKGKVRMFLSMGILFFIPCLIVRDKVMTITLTMVYLAHLLFFTWYFNKEKKTHSFIEKDSLKEAAPED